MAPKLGIVAGGGELPARLIDACRAAGRDHFVLALEGHAEPARIAGAPQAWIRLGAAGSGLDVLHREGVEQLVMAGPVRRPSLSELRPDWRTTKFFAKIGLKALGDDGLLRAIIHELEAEEGFRVVGIEAILGELPAAAGVWGGVQPDAQALADIERGVAVLRGLGPLDIGQSVIVQQGLVIGVEAVEGTDGLIDRCAPLRREGPAPVLVKMAKPGQERRADLPTVGTETVRRASAAGLRGIAVEAGSTVVVGREAMVAAADAAGMFVVGISPNLPLPHPGGGEGLGEGESQPKETTEWTATPKRAAVGGAPLPQPSPPLHGGEGFVDGPLLYVIAGEPSGDQLGARLMAALKQRTGGNIRFAGIGGEMMAAEGLQPLFPMAELSVMGLAEVLPRIPRILRRLKQTLADINAKAPAAVVTIDSWGFTGRVHKGLKAAGSAIPRVHYVAPMVWAWKEGRSKQLAERLDLLMCLLPNEPPYFERHGLKALHVGHAVIESGAEQGDGAAFRTRHGLGDAPLLCVLPGSRHSETSRLLPVFGPTLALLKQSHPELRFVVPTVETVAAEVAAAAATWPVPTLVVRGAREKYDAFAACDVALAASGTVALELALARLPTVITYRMNAATAFLARRLIKLKYVTLVNILLDRPVMPELLLGDCRPDRLAAAVRRLLNDPPAREAQRQGMAEALTRLGYGQDSPSLRAADAVLAVIDELERRRA